MTRIVRSAQPAVVPSNHTAASAAVSPNSTARAMPYRAATMRGWGFTLPRGKRRWTALVTRAAQKPPAAVRAAGTSARHGSFIAHYTGNAKGADTRSEADQPAARMAIGCHPLMEHAP